MDIGCMIAERVHYLPIIESRFVSVLTGLAGTHENVLPASSWWWAMMLGFEITNMILTSCQTYSIPSLRPDLLA